MEIELEMTVIFSGNPSQVPLNDSSTYPLSDRVAVCAAQMEIALRNFGVTTEFTEDTDKKLITSVNSASPGFAFLIFMISLVATLWYEKQLTRYELIRTHAAEVRTSLY